MKKILFALLALALLASCAAAPEPVAESPEVSETPALSEQPFDLSSMPLPRLDGSTATIPLGEAITALYLGETREEAAKRVNFSGTNRSVAALAEGDADLLLVYEPPGDTMAEYGKKLDFQTIGRDALVFLVNAANPVDSITTTQLQQIYTGEITNWSEVGGEDAAIIPYQRNATSGSETLMWRLVLGGLKPVVPPENLIIAEMEGLVAAVASYDNGSAAIGYNVYYYVSQMKNDPNVKLLAIDGVAPSDDTIRDGSYPFTNDFYAAIRKNEPEDSSARLLFNWLQGPWGAELLTENGYIYADIRPW
jgi:phosphate transport system substrate-binding protein